MTQRRPIRHVFAIACATLALGMLICLTMTSLGLAGTEPGMEEGKLATVAEPLGKLLQLTLEGKTLRLDRESWSRVNDGKTEEELLKEQVDKLIARGLPKELADREAKRAIGGAPVNRLWSQIQSAAGTMGSGTSSSMGRMKLSFTGRELTGSLSYTENMPTSPFQVIVTEETAPNRSLQFRAEGGVLRITVLGPDNNFVLMLTQSEEGEFRVVHVAGDKMVSLKDENFLTFYGKNRQYTEQQLLPLLKHVGIGLPMTPYDAGIRSAVLDQLRGPASAEDDQRASQLIEQLGSNSYAKREEATKLLSEGFLRYSDAIENAAKKASEPETADRLKKILQDNAGTRKITGMVSSLKLTQDPQMLVLLLKDAREADRELLAKALEKTTGQKFGTDAAAWEKWLASQGIKLTPPKVDKPKPQKADAPAVTPAVVPPSPPVAPGAI